MEVEAVLEGARDKFSFSVWRIVSEREIHRRRCFLLFLTIDLMRKSERVENQMECVGGGRLPTMSTYKLRILKA